MTDLIYDYISMGVDMLLTAAIVSAIVVLLRGTIILNQYSSNQQAASERINYYREFNKYDCTNNLVSADVISAMLYYRYDLEVVIVCNDGTIFTNKPNTSTQIDGSIYRVSSSGTFAKIDTEAFRDAFDPNFVFRGHLYEEQNAPYGQLNSGGSPSINGYGGGIITGLLFEYDRRMTSVA